MTDNTQPDALRLVEQYDYGDPVAHSNTWKAAVCNELRRLHAENEALQAGYDAARLEIDHLRGVTKMVEPVGEYPPSAAYAELPIPSGVSDDGYNLFLLTQMRDFADRTHALRASHGQEPAPTPQADSQPALPKITAEDRSFLHYNPKPVAQWDAQQRAMDARHAAIYRWIIQHIDKAASIIDAWREDGEADKDELHDALAARAAKEGAQHG